jgi:hypothetical protein
MGSPLFVYRPPKVPSGEPSGGRLGWGWFFPLLYNPLMRSFISALQVIRCIPQ